MKNAEVLSGQYAGKTAIILGSDRDYLGHTIFADTGEMGRSYLKRWSIENFPISSKVLICNIDGQEIALSESNFKKDENAKSKSGSKESTGTEGGSKSND